MKAVPFSNERYTKGEPVLPKWYRKGRGGGGVEIGGEPPV